MAVSMGGRDAARTCYRCLSTRLIRCMFTNGDVNRRGNDTLMNRKGDDGWLSRTPSTRQQLQQRDLQSKTILYDKTLIIHLRQ